MSFNPLEPLHLSFSNIVFDEKKHPRLHGKFTKVVGSLGEGETKTVDGVTIKRGKGGGTHPQTGVANSESFHVSGGGADPLSHVGHVPRGQAVKGAVKLASEREASQAHSKAHPVHKGILDAAEKHGFAHEGFMRTEHSGKKNETHIGSLDKWADPLNDPAGLSTYHTGNDLYKKYGGARVYHKNGETHVEVSNRDKVLGTYKDPNPDKAFAAAADRRDKYIQNHNKKMAKLHPDSPEYQTKKPDTKSGDTKGPSHASESGHRLNVGDSVHYIHGQTITQGKVVDHKPGDFNQTRYKIQGPKGASWHSDNELGLNDNKGIISHMAIDGQLKEYGPIHDMLAKKNRKPAPATPAGDIGSIDNTIKELDQLNPEEASKKLAALSKEELSRLERRASITGRGGKAHKAIGAAIVAKPIDHPGDKNTGHKEAAKLKEGDIVHINGERHSVDRVANVPKSAAYDNAAGDKVELHLKTRDANDKITGRFTHRIKKGEHVKLADKQTLKKQTHLSAWNPLEPLGQ